MIGVLLPLIPLGQALLFGGGALSSAALMIAASETAQAESPSFYFNRGIDKKNAGDYYGAISDFSKAIEINPRLANVYYNRGLARRKSGDNHGAISDYNKAIELNPSYALTFRNRSVAKEHIGDLKGACSDARKAVSLGDQNEANMRWIEKECQ